MTVSVYKPNITQYQFDFLGEEIYSQCMFAKINLDHDNFVISAVTDVGRFGHSWNKTDEKNGFLKLLMKISPEYLLSKIADETVFLLEESKQEVIKDLKQRDCSEDELNYMIDSINDLDCDAKTFYFSVSSITGEYFDCDSDFIIMDYPEEAKIFVSIFEKYLRPILGRELKQNEI